MHLNAATPSMMAPRTRPAVVSTTGAVCVVPVTLSSIAFSSPARAAASAAGRTLSTYGPGFRCLLLTLAGDSQRHGFGHHSRQPGQRAGAGVGRDRDRATRRANNAASAMCGGRHGGPGV